MKNRISPKAEQKFKRSLVYQLISSRYVFIYLLLLNFILAIPGLWVPYYNIDELTNAIFARFILSDEMGLKDFLGNTYFLTHYLYAAIGWLFGLESLVPVHVSHAVWKAGTIFALYWAGRELSDRRVGLWTALLYCLGSYAFMSKDFHTPSAESFSLLPAALCAGFLFRGMNQERFFDYFLAGLCAAIATLFKAPMGITIVAIILTIVIRYKKATQNILVSGFGFGVGMFLPLLFYWPLTDAVVLMLSKLNETNSYIQSYTGISYLYWIFKYFIRTALVLLCLFVLTIFSTQSLRTLTNLRLKHRNYWQKIFFLLSWLLLLGFAVSLGGRVFYHYYVFLLAPLSLMAGAGMKAFNTRLWAYYHHKTKPDERFYFLKTVREQITLMLFLPTLIFSIEGALNASTRPVNVDETISYIKQHTNPDDKIYVWGNLPQIYFYSGRQPATTHFWSDILAGTSPGSPAMEYMRATGKNLTLTQKLIKDFDPDVFQQMNIGQLNEESTLYQINENELFTLEEMLNRIHHPYWKKVFKDFFTHPPELFLDTSPTNVRGFGHTPINRYELLKHFVLDNYKAEAIRNHIIIYRLKKTSKLGRSARDSYEE